MTASRHDVIVVGAGAAGCVLASRLSEDDRRSVLLLEAGPDDPALAAALAVPGRVPSGADWGVTGTVPAWGTSFPLPLIKAVGGNSLLQGGVALRGLPGDYDRWAELGGGHWGHGRLQPAFDRVEHDLDAPGAATGAVSIRRGRPSERGPLHDAFLAACAEFDVPACDDLNRQTRTGVGPIPQARRGAVKETARSAYLDPARGRPNLTVRDRAHVRRLLIRGDRVEGAEVVRGGDVERHEAGTVILAAGAVHSPLLLMRSGVGDPRTLRDAGLPCLVPLTGVGTGLRDHPAVWTTFGLDAASGRPDSPWFQVMMRHVAGAGDDLPDFAREAFHDVRMLPSPVALRRGVLVASLLRPRGTGRVRPAPGRPGAAVVEFGYADDEDVSALRRAVGFGHRVLRARPMVDIGVTRPRLVTVTGKGGTCAWPVPRTLPLPDHPAPLDPGVLARATVTAHHLHGGCPMGSDPEEGAAVDGRCHVHGIEGLFVGDASVVPSAVRANTHLLALLVAEKVTEFVNEEAGQWTP